jgi:mercuric ion transport protein
MVIFSVMGLTPYMSTEFILIRVQSTGANMAIGTKGSLVAGVVAALGASACCAGPLILLLLGIGGGWGSRLVALEPYSPYLTALTVLFLGAAFYRLYIHPRACMSGEVCSTDRVIKNQRIMFWLVALPVALLLTFPLYAPLFY